MTPRFSPRTALILVYDYHPCSTTLLNKHFVNPLVPAASPAAAAAPAVGFTPGAVKAAIPVQQHRVRLISGGMEPASDEEIGPGGGLSEKVIWSYVTQIASAIKVTHAAGLALRTIEPSKILLTGKNRWGRCAVRCFLRLFVDVRFFPWWSPEGDIVHHLKGRGATSSAMPRRSSFAFCPLVRVLLMSGAENFMRRLRVNCVGVFDLINYDGGKNQPHFQQEDLLNFGQLILSLACLSLTAIHNLPKSLDYITRFYSMDLKNVVLYLLSKPSPMKSVDDVVAMMGTRILHEIDSAHYYNDFLEDELCRELENGRLVRVLCKLGFINERPEFDLDPSWSETGDRYLLKLFRDYLFHQVDERGRPVLDMAHVLGCLNKLDVGVDDRVMLVSRDEQSCLIVSYRELKKCAEVVWRDLFRKAV
ncbi:MAG: hypothetical protein BJ554DRAFT_2113 [Olpidium bornovanus]|uniref:Pan3 C-terminal knob domain-containing protein n=1 Tax=Olpidium bornovanus TaxID=278681 RepID=A0A8H8DGP2_9FUNG|nr:MAG: hypothetical protein BJ554DRAFT_2113 [Olpidium bornovanus]